MYRRIALLVAWTFAAAAARGADGPLAVAADGRTVQDSAAQLAWSRCVEGMVWDGKRCRGEPTLASFQEALALARARSVAEGVAWRVPRAAELQRVARIREPLEQLFPNAPTGAHWTSSSRIDTAAVNPYSYAAVEHGVTSQTLSRIAVQVAWSVDPLTGAVRGDQPRRDRLPVRLVRQAGR